MSNEIMKSENFQNALTPAELVNQVALVQAVMKEVMQGPTKENPMGTHYGIIPGTPKPTLLKPGAEKLGMTFRLSPAFDIRRIDLEGGHREYEITCTMTHIPTGKTWGQGVGSCSTMESKFRYRGAELVDTGKPVPQKYWDSKDAELIGGKGFAARKNTEGKWTIHEKGERKENPDLADVYNTILKMAKKRAQVDAILTCTAAGDLFTQDIEDFNPEVFGGTKPPEAEVVKEQNGKAQDLRRPTTVETTATREPEPAPEPQKPEQKKPEAAQAPDNKAAIAQKKLFDLLKTYCQGEGDQIEMLKQLTEWEDKEGKVHEGRTTFKGMSEKMADIARHKLEAIIKANEKAHEPEPEAQ